MMQPATRPLTRVGFLGLLAALGWEASSALAHHKPRHPHGKTTTGTTTTTPEPTPSSGNVAYSNVVGPIT